MFTQGQIEYIQKQQARGLNNDAIRNKLIDAGWEEGDIKDGFEEVERISGIPKVAPTDTVEKPEIVEKKGSVIKIIVITIIFIIILGSIGFAFYKFVYPKIKIDTKVEEAKQTIETVSVDSSINPDVSPEQNVEIPPLPNTPGTEAVNNTANPIESQPEVVPVLNSSSTNVSSTN